MWSELLTLVMLNFIIRNCKSIHGRYLKFSIHEDWDLFILQGQYFDCWWPDDLMIQGTYGFGDK